MPALTICGVVFDLDLPYSAGHKITSSEANALNNLLIADVSKKMKSLITKAQNAFPGGELSDEVKNDLILKMQHFMSTHTFSTQLPLALDPVQKIAYEIAKPLIINALKGQGIDPKTVDSEKMEQFLQILISKRPDILEEAKRRVEVLSSIAQTALPKT